VKIMYFISKDFYYHPEKCPLSSFPLQGSIGQAGNVVIFATRMSVTVVFITTQVLCI
jgi:hypothetical protein